MKSQKRKSLKKVLLTEIIAFVAIIVLIITGINIKMETDKISELTQSVLSKESLSYANEVYNWWSNIEQRVAQTSDVIGNLPEQSYDDTLAMLLTLTELDPDSQDIYMAYGETGKFLDGSGWIPDDTFVFTDRAWYTGAVEAGGAIYTSDPYVDASTGKTCLACAVLVRDQVVLSSDITFDKVEDRMANFKSSSPDAKFFIINKDTKDILVSSIDGLTGTTVDESTDPVMQGLGRVFSSLNTSSSTADNKVLTVSTSSGRMMYAATDIESTSWVVVSAVPYSFVSSAVTGTIRITIIAAILLLLLLAITLYIVINKYINPVTKVTDRIIDISQGNFDVTLEPEGNNEITTLSEKLNEYIAGMRTMLMNMSEISGQMNSSAGECFDISSALSSSNQAQGKLIENLNSTLSLMNDSIDSIARGATELAATSGELKENALNVRDLCDETMNSSQSGKDQMSNMTESVNTLNDTMRGLTEIIRQTAKSIEEITGITDTINSISEQTNLLSLNASIEAARAGEMGKGFAVVASEVGVLANQSSEATDTIRQLISDVTHNIEDINRKADICMTDMEACLEGVENANQSFNTIFEDVSKATEGITEIASGIEKINDFATDNAATTEEQASSINEILGLSEQIVAESRKVLEETDSITDISQHLNKFSDEINSDLSQYTLGE